MLGKVIMSALICSDVVKVKVYFARSALLPIFLNPEQSLLQS